MGTQTNPGLKKKIPNNKRTAIGITTPDFKLCNRAIVKQHDINTKAHTLTNGIKLNAQT